MRLFVFSLTFLACVTSQIHLHAQSELAKRNGFKDIKLGGLIDSVKGAEFKKDIIEGKEFPAKLYEIHHKNYDKIGSVDVKHIELKVYRGFIYQITVFTEKDPQVMKALEKTYGKAIYSIRSERFYWKSTDTLSLVYKGHPKKIELIYRSMPIGKLMFTDKGKKVEEIADDF
ncbi:MAG: hypothetical protein HOP30_20050 [Cyclobacteriaceae bacterium]|nr:hypothetical protein [Cyclobacteriaceae bacterium]